MATKRRLAGGHIDRTRPLTFRFNNRTLSGFHGDSVASALLANGVRVVGRSFKYHRPRGIFTATSAEPNALLTLTDSTSGTQTPNIPATTIPLTEGLVCRSQGGGLTFDPMAINDWLAPFISAGFYYKTFMWPRRFWERVYEPLIRRAAGLGALAGEADTAKYDHATHHSEVLIIGGGVAGITAALRLARAGVRLCLVDEDFRWGGQGLGMTASVDDTPYGDWVAQAIAELASLPHVRLLPQSVVFGVYDHNCYGVLENCQPQAPYRQIMWRVIAKHSILATGAIERSMAFTNNDRPHIMLAGAVRQYALRFATACGGRVAVLTCNDSGIDAAHDLITAGVKVTAVLDTRAAAPSHKRLQATRLIPNARIRTTYGRKGLSGIRLSDGEVLPLDCLAVAGGWSPALHLACHLGGRPTWNDRLAAFLPAKNAPQGMHFAGSVMGAMSSQGCITSAAAAADQVLAQLGKTTSPSKSPLPKAKNDSSPYTITPCWHMAAGKSQAWSRAFIDLQNDVTSHDIAQANAEGYSNVEHLKRYTTLGMATDQGKTSNILGMAILAEARGESISGSTTFRPPYTPIAIGAMAGRRRGKQFRPTRVTPSHTWGENQTPPAVFMEVGDWLRARYYPRVGEKNWHVTVAREVTTTRTAVGICDVSTLGKIDIQGRDAVRLLDLVYANGFSRLPLGRVRYGIMLREDGFVLDDGTTARLGDEHFVMTTTTAEAATVFRHLQFCHQCLYPHWDVRLVSVTEQFAQYAIAGPKSRALLQAIVDKQHDLSNAAFPFMACAEVNIANGIGARLFRISFCGELAYELAVPARYGDALWRRLMQRGQQYGITAYGTEALSVMRIEKGHIAGGEINGQTCAHHLGLAGMLAGNKDYIGKTLAARHELQRDDGLRLVGLVPINAKTSITAGSHILAPNASLTAQHGKYGMLADPSDDLGWVSSATYSPSLGHWLGLAFVMNGMARLGETVRVVDSLRQREVLARITGHHFYDPDGIRQKG